MIRFTFLLCGLVLLVVSGAMGWARREEARSSYLLAFNSHTGGLVDIFIMTSDGRHLYHLVDLPKKSEYLSAWLPDGRWLIFTTMNTDNVSSVIWRVRTSGQDLQALTSLQGVSATDAAWLPDGKQIIYVNYNNYEQPSEIWRMEADGSGARFFFEQQVWHMVPLLSQEENWVYFIKMDNKHLIRVRPDGSGWEDLNLLPHSDSIGDVIVAKGGHLWYSYSNLPGERQISTWQIGETETWPLPKPPLQSQGSPFPTLDGRTLYYLEESRLMRFDLQTGQAQNISPLAGVHYGPPKPSPPIDLPWQAGWNISLGALCVIIGGYGINRRRL